MPMSTPASAMTDRNFRKTTLGRLLRHRTGTLGLVIVVLTLMGVAR